MGLVETQIVVQFAGGVETKQDRKGVLPAQLLALENAVFTKAISLVKRNGYHDLGRAVMGSEELMPPAVALGSRGDELLAFTADQVYSYVEDAERWIAAGDLRSVITSHAPVAKTGTNQTVAECAVNDGIALYAWEDSAGGVWYSLTDDATGRTLVAPTQADEDGQQPRCIALGGFLHLLYALTAPREIRLLRFAHDAPTVAPTQIILVTDLHPTASCYDLTVYDGLDETVGALAWIRDTGDLAVAYLHGSGALGGLGLGLPTPVTVTAAATTVAIAGDDEDTIAVFWGEADGDVRQVSLDDSDLSENHAPRTVVTAASAPVQLTAAFDGRTSDDGFPSVWVAYQLAAVSPQNHMVQAVRTDTDTAGLHTIDSWTVRGIGLASKAFRYGEDAYLHMGRDSTLYRTYYTVRADGHLVIARFLSGLGNGHLARPHLPNVWPAEDDAATWFWPAIRVTDVDTAEDDVFGESGISRVTIDFDSPEAFRSVQLGATLYVAGGLLHAYDGTRVVEAGFHYGIDDVGDPALGAPSGPGIADGTYGYVFVLENILANGEVERGPVSAPVLVEVTGGPRRVTFAIPTDRLTAKPNARIGVYRSEDGDDSFFWRVSSLDPSTLGDVNGYVANDADADTVTFIDEMPDGLDGLLRQEPLYTTGDIVENDPLGGARLVAGGKNRLFVVDAADPLTVYYSQEIVPGYAVEFSPRLRLRVDPYGGAITGLVVRDSVIDVFKESAVFSFGGQGPLANPDVGNQGWSGPEMSTSDVGCIAADSTAYTPAGSIFQSRKGIRLMGRDGGVVPIGDPVDLYKGQTISAATLIDGETQIRLLSPDGETLLFDYERVQWSVFKNHRGLDAVVVGGVYHYLRTDGRVWRETEDAYRDGGAPIPMAMETAWLKLAGHAQGWQRTWFLTVLGEYRSAHKLKLYIAYDYQEGWTGDPILLDPAESRVEGAYGEGNYGDGPYGGGADTRYQFEVHIGQENQAIRFRFEDVEATGDAGASYELTELLIVGGVERSRFQIEEARRF